MNYKQRVRDLYRKERTTNIGAQRALEIARYEAQYGEHSKKRDLMPDRYLAYDGERTTILPNGWKIRVEFHRDEFTGAPWHEFDGHGVVTECQGRDESMWTLACDRSSYRLYDWRATLPKAIKEGWDAPPYNTGNKHEQAMRAIKADFECLRDWLADRWWYVGLVVTLLDAEGNEISEESCWGYESDDMGQLTWQARTWGATMIRKARRDVREAEKQARIEARFHDAMENAL